MANTYLVLFSLIRDRACKIYLIQISKQWRMNILYNRDWQLAAHCLFLQIKFHWNAAMPIWLHIVDGCFHAIKVESSSCNSDRLACKAY